MSFADQAQRRTRSLARAQPQRSLGMLDREIVLTGPQPQDTTQKPAAGEARGERQGAVDQRHHGADILAEIGQNKGGVGQDARVVPRHLERLPGKIDRFAGGLRLFGPALSDEPHLAHRRQGQRRTAVPVDRYRLMEQFQSLEKPLFGYWIIGRKRAQIEIVGSEVMRRTGGRAARLQRLAMPAR